MGSVDESNRRREKEPRGAVLLEKAVESGRFLSEEPVHLRHLFPILRDELGEVACLPVVLALLAAGCTQQVQRRAEFLAVAPMLSVERFLQASNARDYDAMARLFGSVDGPVAETGSTFGCAFKRIGSWVGLGDRCRRWQEVELWMATISDVLRHQDYRITSERLEPGRTHVTNRIGVDITREGQVIRDVPFLVVRTEGGAWLIEEIALERITGH